MQQATLPGIEAAQPITREFLGFMQVYGYKGINRWRFIVRGFPDDASGSVYRMDGTCERVPMTRGGSLQIGGRNYSRDHWDH